jgi:hypothetical protein
MSIVTLQIPESGKRGLAALIQLPAGTADSLYDALTGIPPRLRSRDIHSRLIGQVELPSTELRAIVDVLITLYSLRELKELPTDAFIDEVCIASEQTGDPRLRAPNGDWSTFKDRLRGLLSLERSLGVTAKALFVAYQYPRHYHAGRILTDARPVFSSNASDEPAAFIINHNLKIDIHEEGEDREWFVTMNSADLEELKRVVDRAIAKEKSLTTSLEKTGASVLEWDD